MTRSKSKNAQRSDKDLKTVSLLGNTNTSYPETYSPETLEVFPNKNPKSEAWTTFVCTEFTSLCPKTGQPDFATINIKYEPGSVITNLDVWHGIGRVITLCNHDSGNSTL